MIMHCYECKTCKEITERLVDSSDIPDSIDCPVCCGFAKKIFIPSQTNPVDASWINTVLEVVDKDSGKPHCQEFLKHPTRSNYKGWMKGEGLRHLEDGEPTMPKIDKGERKKRIKEGMFKRFQERNAVSCRG